MDRGPECIRMTLLDSFFAAYEARLAGNWSAGYAGGDAAYLIDQQRLLTPGLPRDRVGDTLAESGFGAAGITSYMGFLARYRCESLDCDGLVEFANSTSLEVWSKATTRMRGALPGAEYFAFGFDAATSARFCLQRRSVGTAPVVSIVDGGNVVSSVFSSFEALLAVMTEVLNVPLYVARGEEPSREQRALVRRLRDIDPPGFGAVGWPDWFARSAGGSDW